MKEFLAFTKYFASFPVLVCLSLIKNSILHISLSHPRTNIAYYSLGSYPSSSAPRVLISPLVSRQKKKNLWKGIWQTCPGSLVQNGGTFWYSVPHCNHVRSREGTESKGDIFVISRPTPWKMSGMREERKSIFHHNSNKFWALVVCWDFDNADEIQRPKR